MTFTYPVLLTQKDDGSWEGEFPDLEGCRCSGKTLHDALEDARLSMYNWIDLELKEEDDPDMPYVTELEDIQKLPGQEARNIMVHYRYTEGWEE